MVALIVVISLIVLVLVLVVSFVFGAGLMLHLTLAIECLMPSPLGSVFACLPIAFRPSRFALNLVVVLPVFRSVVLILILLTVLLTPASIKA